MTHDRLTKDRLGAIRAVLFDKDGTLIDFARTWFPANQVVLRHFSGGDAACLARLEDAAGFDGDGGGFSADSPMIAGATADFGPLLAAAIPRSYDAAFLAELDAIIEREGLACTVAIGDPAAICAALSAAGFVLGLATNGPVRLAEDHARVLGIRDRLAFVCGYDSGFGRKPGPGMVHAFCAATGIAPDHVAVVGDTLHDLHMARAAGAFGIGVPSGLTPAVVLAPYADLMVSDLDDLLAHLRRSSLGPISEDVALIGG
jgi:phosphoglycolate phosphatase